MTVFSSPQKLYLVLMTQNRRQRVLALLLDYWYVERRIYDTNYKHTQTELAS